MVGDIPRIICSSMIAVFVQRLQLGSFKLHVTSAWLSFKAHPPNKGCVICNKTIRLTDEYVFNSEVRLISGLYIVLYFVCAKR